MLGDKKGRR